MPADGFLRSSFWLPRGWSTVGFQVLAGFTIGLMFTAADRSRQRRMWVRAARLAAVMVGSNIILLACKYALWGQFWRFKDPSWWIGAATFTADSSISIFLAPTIVLLAATPWLLALERQVSNELFAAFAITLFVGGWALFGATTSSSYQLSAGWVVLPLAGNGLVGLVLGSWWSRNEAARRSVRPRAASVAFVCLAAIVASLSPAPLVQMTVGTVLRFAAIVTLAMTLLRDRAAGRARDLEAGAAQHRRVHPAPAGDPGVPVRDRASGAARVGALRVSLSGDDRLHGDDVHAARSASGR